jgi:2-dehydropantoate 2-reductase
VLAHISEDRLVQGLIGFLSFQSPLPGAPHLPAGIAYSLLPFSASTFDGVRAPDVVTPLRRGGFPARIQRDLPRRSAERSATTVPIMAGLEIAGWRLPNFVRGPWLGWSLAASREALAAVAAVRAWPPARISRTLHPLPVRVALAMAPRLAPFDLEAYLQFHFTKVGPQTRLMLETYAAHARAVGGSSEALRRLRESL